MAPAHAGPVVTRLRPARADEAVVLTAWRTDPQRLGAWHDLVAYARLRDDA